MMYEKGQGFTNIQSAEDKRRTARIGIIHEMGCVRNGKIQKRPCLNALESSCITVRMSLFTDGACMTRYFHQNPTFDTLLAITARAPRIMRLRS